MGITMVLIHENTVLFIMPCYPEYIVETRLRVL